MWSWYGMISGMCDDDILKIQEMYKLPIKAVLNHLSYKMSKQNLKKS